MALSNEDLKAIQNLLGNMATKEDLKAFATKDDFASIRNEVAELSESVGSLGREVTGLSEKVDSLGRDVSELTEKVDSMRGSLINIENEWFPKIGAALDGIHDLQRNRTLHHERIEVLENKTEKHEDDIAYLKQTIIIG